MVYGWYMAEDLLKLGSSRLTGPPGPPSRRSCVAGAWCRHSIPTRPVPRAEWPSWWTLASRGPAPARPRDGTSWSWRVRRPPDSGTSRCRWSGGAAFGLPSLLDAPVIALPLADAAAYVARYRDPDKAARDSATGRGLAGALLDDRCGVGGHGAAARGGRPGGPLFFGVFQGEAELRAELGIPGDLQLSGAIALGWPVTGSGAEVRPGQSAGRRRRPPGEIIHRGGW